MKGKTAMASSYPIVKSIDFWREVNWFAIHAKPRRESFAAANICTLGLEILFPRIKVEHLLRGFAQQMIKPLFPGYFFTMFCPENSLESVKAAPGVLRVVSSGRMPISVPDKVIREIQDRVQEDGFVRIRTHALAPGSLVRIHSGPFEGMMGRVERELDDQKRVAILLESLLNARVLIERRWVEEAAA